MAANNSRRSNGPEQENSNASPRTSTGKGRQGLASMSEEKKREIQSKGGKASHGGGRKSNASRENG